MLNAFVLSGIYFNHHVLGEVMMEDIKNHRYGCWAANEKGYAYEEGKCAAEIQRGWVGAQCSRKNGHGKDGLFCKQHKERDRP